MVFSAFRERFLSFSWEIVRPAKWTKVREVDAKMLWIGLTGGIASGKSTVSRILRSKGFKVVDADLLAREAVQVGTPALEEIRQAFGPGVITSAGELDRKRIGEIVFADATKRERLEAIIHPRVRELAAKKRAELKASGETIAFYDVPLLYEKNMESMFDKVVVVLAERSTQLSRLMKRDGLTVEEAERRVLSQMPIGEKAKRATAVIRNEGDPSQLEHEIDTCLKVLFAHQAQT